ncbi:hypothetical protein IFM89_034764 [Coptis chinensis]|uniref:Uncharacterized protein n=1 Tax=Coptis chinensis TaxID=261450 RepID=A0A835H7N0_9MAGN|nr:hypothetical protein IFM89_034764 [Coptis chinensis]
MAGSFGAQVILLVTEYRNGRVVLLRLARWRRTATNDFFHDDFDPDEIFRAMDCGNKSWRYSYSSDSRFGVTESAKENVDAGFRKDMGFRGLNVLKGISALKVVHYPNSKASSSSVGEATGGCIWSFAGMVIPLCHG